MPGVPREVIEHKLMVRPDAKPVKQKLRRFAPDQKQAIREELDKLLKAGFIREVLHPEWLANPVMVRKANGKWSMCVNFILTSPSINQFKHAIHLNFRATNNTAEYEGLLAGIRAAATLGVKRLIVKGDSELVTNQTRATFLDILIKPSVKEANDEDSPVTPDISSRATEAERAVADIETTDDWRTPLIKFISSDELPEDNAEADKITRQAKIYCMIGNDLYKKAPNGDYCIGLGVKICFASISHPQSNGQVERANGIVLQGIKTRVYDKLMSDDKKWVEELPSVLWAVRTTPTTSNKETTFFLVYGSEAMLPTELRHQSTRVQKYSDED
uniref:Retrotransposon protein, putative, Ty3-gypsy subclass n=2 Tax=Oryza sativa subsp. japonica TaxID=39947 RepID=Q53KU6_ORYSJ|nr:retrotransposon protein, putative, Ty3-gypsy sub-class [Oryza sativa Japonica Group]ABA93298.1 retrotransposon protein, putative, Ty3-gypsy subclass [Oryza sativa Japonica Group]